MKRPLLGAALGLGLGLLDGLLLEVLGVEMKMGDVVATWPVAAIFGSSFALLGAALGALLDSRQALRQEQDRLVEAEKMASLGRMAAGVAHEVRNPLGTIRSSAELLAERARDDDAEACRFIVEEVDRLDAFVGDILDFSRPVQVEGVSEAPERLVERAVVLAEPMLGPVEVAVDVRGTPLPELLDRVVLGLLVNAAQSGATRVTIDGGPGWLRVRDDGPGIPAELRAQVFEPFFTTKARGTGLGLAMARRVVEAHGGSLHLEDGPGAAFRIQVPA